MKPQLRKPKPKKQGIKLGKKGPAKRGRDIPYKEFKYKKEALAIAIAVLLAILILVLTSSSSENPPVVNHTVNHTPTVKTNIYSAGGIYLEYPETWKITNDNIDGNNLQLVIQDPSSVGNPDSVKLAGFTVYKVEKAQYQTLGQQKDVFIQSLKGNGANINLVSTSNITVSGINGFEEIYAGTGPKNEQLHLKLVYFEQDNIAYILAFLTKGMDLQSQKENFNVVLKSFRLQ